MTLGAFAVIIMLRQKGLIGEELEDLNGLYQRSPALGVAASDLHAFARGHPATAGFMGKYFIFLSLIETAPSGAGRFRCVVHCPALYYYFRVRWCTPWLKQPGEARVMPYYAQLWTSAFAVFVTLQRVVS